MIAALVLAAVAPRDLDTRPAAILAARVGGAAARLLIEPGADHSLMCTPGFAARARLAGGRARPFGRVGPVIVTGRQAHVPVAIDSEEQVARVSWSALPYPRDADCVAGPRLLGTRPVRFLLGPPRADARTTSFPFFRASPGRAYAAVRVGRETLAVRFELGYRRTVLTAAAAQAIARTLGGSATGPVEQEEAAWGVVRPVRRLTLARPFRIGGMTVAAPYVRVRDYGEATELRTLGDEAEAGDVTVRARRRPGAIRLVRVSRDDLSACVSLTVDPRAGRIELVC